MTHKTLGITFLVVVAAAVISGIYYWQVVTQPIAPMPVHDEKKNEVVCGGFAGTKCPEFGYICEAEGNYPDAMTICRKEVSNITTGMLTGHVLVPLPATSHQIGIFTEPGVCTQSYPSADCGGNEKIASQYLDVNGNFQFSVAPGTYYLKVTMYGNLKQFDSNIGKVTVKAGEITTFRFDKDLTNPSSPTDN